jgi:hypothetical protein
MTNVSGPIYEVTINVDREIVDEFDAWLARHIEKMSHISVIVQAEALAPADDIEGRPRRIAQYHFASDSDLEQYLTDRAAALEKSALDRFEGRIEATRRVLRHIDIADGEIRPIEVCLNCGTALGGQYCGSCGQRAASRLISIWELLRDAFGDLLELDSRLWRTLIPLLIRPGKLTRDYLEGRRARYMPPFRMYLVMSIVFFLVAFFDPREDLSILFEPEDPAVVESEESADDADAVRDEVMGELAAEGIIAGEPDGTGVAADAAADEDEAASAGQGVEISIGGDPKRNCDVDDINDADLPDWLASRLTEERLKVMCDRIIADDGQAFLRELLDNVPAALFVLLPLMALVLKILYPLSKRYYVEHLLFVVHYHAFVFLILTLQVLFRRLGTLIQVPEAPIDAVALAASLYVPVYLYKSQRRVYEQGRFFTILKFLILTFAYFGGLFTIFAMAAIFAAFSI